MEAIQWTSVNGHECTDEERLLALRWCEKNRVVVDYRGQHDFTVHPKFYDVARKSLMNAEAEKLPIILTFQGPLSNDY